MSTAQQLPGFLRTTTMAKDAPIHSPSPEPSTRRPVLSLRLAIVSSLLLCFTFYHGWPQAALRKCRHSKPTVGSIRWNKRASCNPGTECGSIIVPKDYFDEAAGTASIAFAVFRATKSPKKGTVFLNPGGPGGSGTRLATQQFADIIGYDWDLLGFDPRGINKTSPRVACFSSMSEINIFSANTVLEKGFTVSSSNISDPDTRAAVEAELVAQAREFSTLKQAQAQVCAESMGDELKYMGTANVACVVTSCLFGTDCDDAGNPTTNTSALYRDMDFMAQAFDGKGAKINYWGASYGSILGAYLVNMLPSRVGYVVIDGIVDPINWSTEPSHKWSMNWLASTEKTYKYYLQTCSTAGPERCPIAKRKNEPYADIMARIETFLDKLAVTPLAISGAGVARPGILTSGSARALLLMYLERPPLWSESAHAFAEAISGNGTILYNKLTNSYSTRSDFDPTTHYDLSRLGVSCMDSPPPYEDAEKQPAPTPEDLAAEFLRTMELVSPHFGASVSVGEPDGGCQFWPTAGRGPERFAGPWGVGFQEGMEVPMLIVSNTMDPITPIESGLRINSFMPDSSTIIIQDGPGHCSTAIATPCTQKLVRDYYAGVMPANGTVCATEYDFFPSGEAVEGSVVQAWSEEDERLAESVRVVGELLQDIRRS
ncbi:hypothetical protein HMN09_00457700 [Mycena chlorophos]|uniref:Alpha/beta-hydrolase n=1 Tax=Mycena chlorophos TaxID=658473 RepID=A0A8H6TH49_MYCCL|nr:hypothetical protein HMN09_00457700 [Mycena chlorophos]